MAHGSISTEMVHHQIERISLILPKTVNEMLRIWPITDSSAYEELKPLLEVWGDRSVHDFCNFLRTRDTNKNCDLTCGGVENPFWVLECFYKF